MRPEIESSIETKMKTYMCGNNFTGNLFYWAWKNVDCTCCAFFRGMVIGNILTVIIALVL